MSEPFYIYKATKIERAVVWLVLGPYILLWRLARAALRALFDALLFGLPPALRAWLMRRLPSLAFAEEFGDWPLVRRGKAPGVLLMKAPYVGPRRYQENSGLKPLAVVAFAVAVFYHAFWKPLIDEAIFTGVIAGAASYPLVRMARKTRFVIRFDGDVISWKGPDRKKQRVRLEEIHSLEVIAPHRWAAEEARKHSDYARRNPRAAALKPLFQDSSELILHTGPEGSHWRTVAEFVNDAHGEQANRLKRAIEVVIEKVRTERAATGKQAAAGPLD